MTSFEVTLRDRSQGWVHDADAYAQEGPFTTFFRSERGRATLDAWCVRVASYRTAELLSVRRVEAPADPGHAPVGLAATA